MNLFEDLEYRGLVFGVTDENIKNVLNNEKISFYLGTDPTGDSLHVGHLLVFLLAKRLEKYGHKAVLLIGGATGFIGDPKPGGEREFLTHEKIESNANALYKQVKNLFNCEMVNNYDWTSNISYLDFLRDFGKLFNVAYMCNKDTVKSRLESGISYTEFSYQLLQARDFYHLYVDKNVTLQIGGQDQWGNITSGLELIRKKCGSDVKCYGLTAPLVTKSDGTKFGKSESGTVWLSAEKTSPYELYQFSFNTEDAKVIEYLKKLTFLTKEEIEALEVSLKEEPHLRKAQRALAEEVVKDLHGEEGLDSALTITNALFRGKIQDLSDSQKRDAIKNMEKRSCEAGIKLEDVLVNTKIASSKREAREWIKGNSIMMNGVKVTDPNMIIGLDNACVDNFSIFRRGKKNYYCVELA
jgi:tyrosyl-tRNA synthetase